MENFQHSLGARLVNISQLLDAATSVLFLFLDPHGGCESAGITVIILGALGALFAFWGSRITGPMNKYIGYLSTFTNLLTVAVGLAIVGQGDRFSDCTSLKYQLPLVFPAFVTSIFSCILVD